MGTVEKVQEDQKELDFNWFFYPCTANHLGVCAYLPVLSLNRISTAVSLQSVVPRIISKKNIIHEVI